MKKAICALALTTLFCGAAFAANGSYTVSAALSPDITVNIDGVDRTFYNVQGQEVHPISYAGTTYVPIRSIGELMVPYSIISQGWVKASRQGRRGMAKPD